MPAKILMIQGTGSGVGKSLLATALCRLFVQDGFTVRPFKAQNMSNNAAVTDDGGEISRAQAEQAWACRVEPSVLTNPILLKPTTDVGAQVIVMGRSVGTMTATAYDAFKLTLRETVLRALQTLLAQAELVVIEGAGSPAEINLAERDLVNMWLATQVGANVVIVGDIDRGGVFAQLVGTIELLRPEERGLVRGFLINKFRGDFSLLEPGLRWLETRTGLPVLGTIPYLDTVELAEEDSLPSDRHAAQPTDGQLRIDVIRLPRMSNFTDFDALAREPDVRLRFVDRPADNRPDCVILPGTKSTIADLASLRVRGFEPFLHRCRAEGTELVGLCGGFQMLGREIRDPDRVEAAEPSARGLGLLPVVTVFHREKTTRRVRGVHLESGLPVAGYEIHAGRTVVPHDTAVVTVTERGRVPTEEPDGCRSLDGAVWGTYLHGVFDDDQFRTWWLNRLRRRRGLPERAPIARPSLDDPYDRLADAVRPHLNLQAVYDLLALTPHSSLATHH